MNLMIGTIVLKRGSKSKAVVIKGSTIKEIEEEICLKTNMKILQVRRSYRFMGSIRIISKSQIKSGAMEYW